MHDGHRDVGQARTHRAAGDGPPSGGPGLALRALLGILVRRRQLIVVPVLVATVFAAVGALLTPETYRSSTSIALGGDELPDPLGERRTAGGPDVAGVLDAFDTFVGSRPVLEQLIERLDLLEDDADPLATGRTVGALRGAITADATGADAFRVEVTWDDPVHAKELAGTVTELFIETSLAAGRREAAAAVRVVEEQLDPVREDLVRARDRLTRYREEHPAALPGRREAHLAELHDHRRSLAESGVDVEELALRVALLEERLADAPSTGDGSSSSEPSSDRARRARLRDAEDDLAAARLRHAAYAAIVAELEAEVAGFPRVDATLDALEREVALRRDRFEQLRTAAARARADQRLELRRQEDRFRILDGARVPSLPAAPDVPLIVLGGLLGGLFTGLVLVVVSEVLDPTVVREEERASVVDGAVRSAVPEHRTLPGASP